MDLLALQKSVNKADSGLDRLRQQAKLNLHHDKPVDEDLAVISSQDRLIFKVASSLTIAGLELLFPEKCLMNSLDIVALHQLL